MQYQNLTGSKFGYWTVKNHSHKDKWGNHYFGCVCDCGETGVIAACNLRSGKTTSCGCKPKPMGSKGGISRHPLYRKWSAMNERCNNPQDAGYIYYGASGIKVCEEWHKSNPDGFINYKRDIERLGSPLQPDMQIDRINNNGDYAPDNVRWASRKTQMNNRRCNLEFEINGETKTLKQWAEVVGIKYSTLRERIMRNWGIIKALTKPVQQMRHKEGYELRGLSYVKIAA